jgi:hypothetical protein
VPSEQEKWRWENKVSLGESGTFVRARGRTWFVEARSGPGTVKSASLVSVEDDSQGERLELNLEIEIDAQVVDPDDWSSLHETSFEGPERLGAYWLPWSEW